MESAVAQQETPAIEVRTIEMPDQSMMQDSIKQMVEVANAITIQSPDDYAAAGAELKNLVQIERMGVALFADAKAKAREAHKAICQAERWLLEPIQKAKRDVSQRRGNWDREQRRIAAEKQRRLEAEQRKRDEDRRLAEAEKAEAAGDSGLADKILDEADQEPTVPMPVEPETPKVEGVYTVTRWKAEVTDKVSLIRFVAANPSWNHLLDPVMKELNALARAQQNNMTIPGVKAVPKSSSQVRL